MIDEFTSTANEAIDSLTQVANEMSGVDSKPEVPEASTVPLKAFVEGSKVLVLGASGKLGRCVPATFIDQFGKSALLQSRHARCCTMCH